MREIGGFFRSRTALGRVLPRRNAAGMPQDGPDRRIIAAGLAGRRFHRGRADSALDPFAAEWQSATECGPTKSCDGCPASPR